MKILIPLELPIHRSQLVQLVKRRTAYELADLVALTCDVWDDLNIISPSDLYERLEWLVVNRHPTQRVNYSTTYRNVLKLIDALGLIYDLISPYVDEVGQNQYPNQSVVVQLVGWNANSPVLEILPQSET